MDLVAFCTRPDTTHVATYTPSTTGKIPVVVWTAPSPRVQSCARGGVHDADGERSDIGNGEWRCERRLRTGARVWQ